jgi:hypothetical protein
VATWRELASDDPIAPGHVRGHRGRGGTPIQSAIGFGQWHAVRRLHERGAVTSLSGLAILGLADRVAEALARPDPDQEEPTPAGIARAASQEHLSPGPNLCKPAAD